MAEPATQKARSSTTPRVVDVAGVAISKPNHILSPAGISKLELARYYARVARWMLPRIENRPPGLVQHRRGSARGIYLRHDAPFGPRHMKRVKLPLQTKSGFYLIIDSVAALDSLAAFEVIETIAENPAAELTAASIEWIRERLQQDQHRAWFRERWRRSRGQIGDPAYPPAVPRDNTDTLVSFSDVFPYDFDLTVIHERRLYLADDQYCLNPACSCDDLLVQFVDAAAGKSSIGHARASVRHLKAPEIEGPPLISQLWSALVDRHQPRRLRDRFNRMRKVARQSLAIKTSSAPRQNIGRNAPCPCGSGKKCKRCCFTSSRHA